MQPSIRFSLSVISLAVSALLAGCGGGGGGSTNPTPNTPTPSTPVPTTTPPDTSQPVVPATPTGALHPSDPANKNAANAAGITGKGVTVGVIDTDFNLSNPELSGRINKTVYESVGPNGNTNPNGNGNPHGTKVSEAIGGTHTGIAPDVKIEGAASGGAAAGYDNVLLKSQIYQDLTAKGVKIFNHSSGIGSINQPGGSNMYASIFRPFVAQGSLFVWATGNDYAAQPTLTAALPSLYPELQVGWLAVTAVNAAGGDNGFSSADKVPGVISSYANRCGVAANWCLAAPGDFVSVESGKRVYGTSFATPMVTGTLALIQQVYPWMNADLLRQTILSTATDMGDTATYGWGLLNASKAVNGPALFDKRLALGNNVNVNFDAYSATFSNDISGDAGLIKGGTGTLTLSGINTYVGVNKIVNGTLNVTGSVSSAVQIDAAGNLSGNGGRIGGSVNNAGRLSNTGKGLRIAGDYTGTATSTLANDVNSTLTVGGTATLGGSHLVATIPAGNSAGDAYITAQAGSTSKVLTAGVAVVGQFGSTSFENNGVAFTPTLITPTVSYSGKEVDMSIVRNNVTAVAAHAFGADAMRNNSAANIEQALKVADNMVASGQTDGANAAFLSSAAALQRSANIEAVGVALDSLSGQIYASAQAQTFQQSQAINRDLSNRLAQLGENNLSTGFWTTVIGASGKLAQSGYAGASTSLWGGQFGVDTPLNKQTIVGAALAYSDGNANFDRFGGSAKSQYAGGSLYARYALANTGGYVTGRVGVAIVDSDVKRAAIVGTETQNLQADHLDRVFSGYVEAGNTLKLSDKNSITPFAGISYDRVKRGDFTETGGSFGLNANSQSYQQIASVLGVRGDSSFDWFAGNSKLQMYAAWQHAFTSGNLDFSAAFNGASSSIFTVQGIGLSRNSGWAGLGIFTEIDKRWGWYANYDIQLGRGGLLNNVLSVGVKVELK